MIKISKFKIVDTNILLSYPQILQKEEDLVIITDVLRELDGLKRNINQEVAYQARRAAIVICRNRDKIQFDDTWENKDIPVDDKLIEATKYYAGILITNDVYLKIKAEIKNLNTRGYGGSEEYTGVIEWVIDFDENGYNTQLEGVLNTKLPPEQYHMKENEYLIVRDGRDNEVLNIFVWRGGELHDVRYHEIRNKWINKIKPRPNNPEQVCLFDALNTPEITIVYAGGCFGVGKSFILNNYALQDLEQGKIKKIVYIPNNAYVSNAMEIGMLPGDQFQKTAPLIGPLIDLIGIDEVTRLIQNEQLEIVPLGYIRGRNFEDSIVIVNEAQNLSAEHIRLLIGRIGNGSRIFFDGSLQQIDTPLFKNRNGLRSLLKIADSEYSDLFATVKLNKIERSRTARVADYLEEVGD